MNTFDEVGDLMAFRMVVEERSFTKAARLAGMSKSRLSARIARLERLAGTALLHRTTRDVTLTDAGATLLESCVALPLAAADARAALRALARGATDELRGELRITAPAVFGRTLIAEVAAEMQVRHPAVSVDLVADNHFVDIVHGGFDVLVRIGGVPDRAVTGRKIATLPQRVVGAPSYLARRGQPRTVADLTSHACLCYARGALGTGATEWRFVSGRRVRPVIVAGPFTANDGEPLLRACLGGVGLFVLPRYRIEAHLESGALIDVLPNAVPVPLQVWALYGGGRKPTAKARRFVDILAQRVARGPWKPESP